MSLFVKGDRVAWKKNIHDIGTVIDYKTRSSQSGLFGWTYYEVLGDNSNAIIEMPESSLVKLSDLPNQNVKSSINYEQRIKELELGIDTLKEVIIKLINKLHQYGK